MTRAIQTAALVFEHALLEQGVPLVVRPEIREYFPDSCENLGRPLADVASNQDLRELPAWGVVAAALEDAMASEWAAEWDGSTAQGPGSQAHSSDVLRAEAFKAWLMARPEQTIAAVCHWGTINVFVNHEPCIAEEAKTHHNPRLGQAIEWLDVPNVGFRPAVYRAVP